MSDGKADQTTIFCRGCALNADWYGDFIAKAANSADIVTTECWRCRPELDSAPSHPVVQVPGSPPRSRAVRTAIAKARSQHSRALRLRDGTIRIEVK